jgi:thiol:disulfide interchange protein DsbG
MKNILLCLAFGLLLTAGIATAAAPEKPAAPRDNPAFRQFQDDGGKMEFLGNNLGVDGWALIDKDGKVVTAIYVTPEGALIKGWLFDPEGNALTPRQLAAYKARINGSQAALPGAEKGQSSKAENFYAQVERAAWVRTGNKDAPYLYMFINVNCGHCQELWKKLKPAVSAGTLQVRLVPFGEADANREGGAALLSVDNPGEAWQKFIEGKADALSKDKARRGAIEKIDANSKLAKEWKLPDVPFTVYRKLTDGVVTAIVGQPENVMMVQADLIRNN